MPPFTEIQSVLIVEDSAPLRRSLERSLGRRFREVHSVATVGDARERLQSGPPDLLLLDFALPDGDAIDLMVAAEACSPVPICIAMSGAASPNDTFALAQLGVRAFLPKPIHLDALNAVLDDVLSSGPDVTPHVRALTGHRPIKDVEEQVRSTMVKEALARSGGNRRAAARMLAISRQMLQHILRR
jgi:DNA-binding NtrC family response regulator